MPNILPTRVVPRAQVTPLPVAMTITTLDVLRTSAPVVEAVPPAVQFPPRRPVLFAVVLTELTTSSLALTATAIAQGSLWPLFLLVAASIVATFVVCIVVDTIDGRRR